MREGTFLSIRLESFNYCALAFDIANCARTMALDPKFTHGNLIYAKAAVLEGFEW
jgi:hypothetical protein